MKNHIKYFGLLTIITLFFQACKPMCIGVASAGVLGALLANYGWYGFIFAFIGGCLLRIVFGIVGMVRRREF